MSLKYAERRIEEALKLAKGNPIRARQQVIAWTFEDPKLLYALTKNHLTGIVAYHIDRVESGRAAAAKQEPVAAKPAAQPKAPVKKTAAEDPFGMEILKAVADSSSEVFGLENSGRPQKRGQASEAHIKALQAMASKSKKT